MLIKVKSGSRRLASESLRAQISNISYIYRPDPLSDEEPLPHDCFHSLAEKHLAEKQEAPYDVTKGTSTSGRLEANTMYYHKNDTI